MKARVYSVALAVVLTLPRILAAQASPVADAFRENARDAAKNLIAAAEEFPADKLTFKPTPAHLDELAAHIAEFSLAGVHAVGRAAHAR